MLKRGVLALYWPARKDPFEACVERATQTLGNLGRVGFARFRRLGRRNADALVFEPTRDNVAELLRRGVNRNDVDRQPIPDLGWRLSLWSGGSDGESFSFGLHCGCYSKWVGNNVLVEFPYSGPLVLANQLEDARAVYTALLGLWKPEQATLCDGDIDWKDDHVLSPTGACFELLQKRSAHGPNQHSA